MSVLEILLLVELILLGAAGVFWVVSLVIQRQYPDDPICIFCRVFWRAMLYPPVAMSWRENEQGASASGSAASASSADLPPPDPSDEKYGRIRRGADGVIHTAILNVNVMPHAQSNQVLGRTSDGIEVQVTAAAEDGAANKAVIQLVADALAVKAYQVTLTKGHYHARKAVTISGLDQQQLQAKLSLLG